jgi:hypothetical protein
MIKAPDDARTTLTDIRYIIKLKEKRIKNVTLFRANQQWAILLVLSIFDNVQWPVL